MTDRIDHAAMAASLLDQQGRWPSDRDGVNLEADRAIAEAQARATLALIEQQRIANLIAIMDISDNELSHAADEAMFEPDPNAQTGMPWRLRPSVAEALGLP